MWLPWRKKKRIRAEVQPDEILIDANISEFDRDQFEGRIEQPLGRSSFLASGVVLFFVFIMLLTRAGDLQIAHGADYAQKALENQLSQHVLIADRGEILDRNGIPLAFDVSSSATSSDVAYTREYADFRGIAHVVGYVKPPAKDSSGFYYRNSYEGVAGSESAFDSVLSGHNGEQLTETDAHRKVVAQSITKPQQTGQAVTLSIDAKVSQALYDAIAARANESHFLAGAGVIMNIQTGEILAMTSYPEYSPNAMVTGNAQALQALNSDPNQPFLNRVTSGLFAPGSTVKPIVAAGALTEGVIDENKKILSTGSISVPNPYDPKHPSVFHDWRANGWVDVRGALAWSSDVYFYEVGGGFQDQPGLGISRLDKYFRMFGFGEAPGLAGFPQASGNIPSPAWKAKTFPDNPTWYLGDTYHTAIGQYGMLVTPLQSVREAAAIANGGELLTPELLASSTPHGTQLPISSHVFEVVREGMRQGVTSGIAQAVKFDFVHVAAKTGTAQIGTHNQFENSWMIGFFPYEHPKYAYAVVLQQGPAGTLMGAPAAMAEFFLWMHQNDPQYLTN